MLNNCIGLKKKLQGLDRNSGCAIRSTRKQNKIDKNSTGQITLLRKQLLKKLKKYN